MRTTGSTARHPWGAIVRFEMTYQLRRWPTWVVFAVFLLSVIGQTSVQVTDALERELPFYAPLFVADGSVTMTLFALIAIAAIAGDAATRDIDTRIEPLVQTAPVSPLAYLGGRLAGALLVNLLLLLTVPVALAAAPLLRADLTSAIAGPYTTGATALAIGQAFLLLVLPNTIVATTLLYAIATMVRHAVGSYAAALLLFLLAVFSAEVLGQGLGQWGLATLFDPVGHASLEIMRNTWAPRDLEMRFVGLGEGLLANRLAWLGVTAAALALAHARVQQGVHGRAGVVTRLRMRLRMYRCGPQLSAPSPRLPVRSAPIVVPYAARRFGAAARVRQTIAVAGDVMREMRTWWSLLLLPYLGVQILVGLEELNVRGTPVLPTTSRILESFSNGPPPIVGGIYLLVILLAGEFTWRERDAGMQALSDAAPVPTGVRFIGKVLGLWLVIVALRSLLLLAGLVIQLQRGWYDVDLALYAQVLYGLQLLPLLVFSLLAVSVQLLVNHKVVGHIAVFALGIGGVVLAEAVGVAHPLLSPLAVPYGSHSGMSGFSPFVTPFLWLMLYWGAWAVLAAVVASLFWPRGVTSGVADRVAIAKRRFAGTTVRVAGATAAVLLLAGGIVFYNTNVLHAYEGRDAQARGLAHYERRYKRYASSPQPQIAATDLQVELYPAQHAARVRGTYRLVNRTARPIDTLHIAVARGVTTGPVAFTTPARAAVVDEATGHRMYVLASPLQPGASLEARWDVSRMPRGFPARGLPSDVVANGTVIASSAWLPRLGYQPDREITGRAERARHGLAPRIDAHALTNIAARSDVRGQELMDVHTIIGTTEGQTAVAPGELRRTWTTNGRRYFEYATDAPVGLDYGLFSARYAVQRATAGPVAIEIVHDPAHPMPLARMQRSVQRSMAQFTARFGPYPYRLLRFVEYPRADGGAHAAHGSIWYSDVFPLMDPDHDERGFDLPYAVIAHETAHQFQVTPAPVEGAALLSESFAWYAAMDVIEAEYGPEHLARFLDFMRRDYGDPRARADVPLLRASDRFQAYRKGPFAMSALRAYVGGARVDLAWRRLIARFAAHTPPYPTSLDLYRELQLVTPDTLRPLLHDLLAANTFWALETRQAQAVPLGRGAWQVTMTVRTRKTAVDTLGVETVVPMPEWVEIGVYGAVPDPGGSARGPLLSMVRRRLRPGTDTVTVTVPAEPALVGIDPRHLLIDPAPADNFRAVTLRPAGPRR